MAAISLIVGSSELLNESMYADFAYALKISMLICAGLGVVGAILSWFRGSVPKLDESEEKESA